ncbi:MAG: hypothetical protein JO093_11440 [Acidobacteria bacterium]|nr:hypothetical protein [Acidobacteriota bacterium]MBV9067826.1 hypothetical protein [Acidobacteriota bacterium]MBV9186231.1 hypothetical protein [Acidobacteriota bacterium]
MSGRWLTRIAAALLFISLAASTLPRLIAIVTNARTLQPLTYEARRERQMGPWYASIEKLRAELPKKEPVALIAPPRDLDAAVFANYYLYPIHTRLFAGRNAYRNAAPDPTRPKVIVAVNALHAERTEYDILRDRDLRAGRRVVTVPQLSGPIPAFILPIAASVDGPSPDTFLIEATLANPNAAPAEVRVTFWPKGVVRTIAIPAHSTAGYYDFVYQLFGIMSSGWIDVESSQPLRGAFYFVNRGRGDATLLPNASPATAIEPGALYRDTKLFIINPKGTRATAILNGESIPLDPHAFISRPIESLPAVGGDVYAFVSTRELNGRTNFLWPQ